MNHLLDKILKLFIATTLAMAPLSSTLAQSVPDSGEEKLVLDSSLNFAVIYENPDPELASLIQDYGNETAGTAALVAALGTNMVRGRNRRNLINIETLLKSENDTLAQLKDTQLNLREVDLKGDIPQEDVGVVKKAYQKFRRTYEAPVEVFTDTDGNPIRNSRAALNDWNQHLDDLKLEASVSKGKLLNGKIVLVVDQVLEGAEGNKYIDRITYDPMNLQEVDDVVQKTLSNGNRTVKITTISETPSALRGQYADLSQKPLKDMVQERQKDIKASEKKIKKLKWKRLGNRIFARGAVLPVLAASVAVGVFAASSTISYLEGVETLDAICTDSHVMRLKARGMAHQQMSEKGISLPTPGYENAVAYNTDGLEINVEQQMAKLEDLCGDIESELENK